jgi:hypothetical protein
VITGGCLCGTVRYEITGKIGTVIYCHCSQCRRASGSAFAANAPVLSKYLAFVSGKDVIREFESSPGKFRGFCSKCGSPLYSRRSRPIPFGSGSEPSTGIRDDDRSPTSG